MNRYEMKIPMNMYDDANVTNILINAAGECEKMMQIAETGEWGCLCIWYEDGGEYCTHTILYHCGICMNIV